MGTHSGNGSSSVCDRDNRAHGSEQNASYPLITVLQPTDLSRNSEQRHNSKPRESSSASPYEAHDQPCICPTCNAQMPNLDSFMKHMLDHIAPTPSPSSGFMRYCGICGEPSRDPIAFNDHIISHAISSVRGRCCFSCNLPFQTRDALQKHYTNVHAMLIYRCSICNVIFETKTALKVKKEKLY